MKTVRLILVEDHEIVRTGLKTFLETQPGFLVIAQASSGESALRLAKELQPDVVVMDITMPDMDGLEATRQIRRLCPTCKVLALTVHADKQYFFEMLAAGAEGYVTKQSAADELVEAIHAVAGGYVYLQPPLASWLLEDYRRLALVAGDENRALISLPSNTQALDVLSPREKQVLEAVAIGLTNQQISEQLGISPKTVARHRERVMNKLHVHSSTELVKFAIRTGLITVD